MDAVLSEDVDTLMFGSGMTIRNWSPELKSGKTPTHVNVYDAVKTKSGQSGLDREGMILVALMSGGDYVPEGIPGCGPKTACEAARAGFGSDLCKIKRTDKVALQEWRERLQHELKTNENKFFARRHTKLKFPDDFPRIDILGYYTHPVISTKAELDRLRRSLKWDQEIDFSGLRSFTYDAFDWRKLNDAKHFIRSMAPSLLVRGLRIRAERNRFAPDNLQAIRKDEALLVKGIHGKRKHQITDNSTELRVSFTPIELVKIDLSKEEPDDEPEVPSSQVEASVDNDLSVIEIADEEEETAPRRREPTKFDPMKPVRIWVLESYVKVGVPLAAEEWEEGQRKPKRAVTTKEAGTTAPKTKGTQRTRITGDMPQSMISQYAKVTKPGAKPAKNLAKAQASPERPPTASQPSKSTGLDMIDLVSSSPAKPVASAAERGQREKSLSPLLEELPSSVNKRRRRGPIQRSRTLPVDLRSNPDRPSTPPALATIETLDLVDSPVFPSPSQLPAKKARTQTARNPPVTRTARQKSITVSPGKGVQTTLDAWRSPAGTPTKPRNATSTKATPLPPPPQFRTSSNELDTLDLTLSPQENTPPSNQPTVAPNPRRSASTSAPRPALRSISSNISTFSTSSKHSTSSRTASKVQNSTHRTSPGLRKTTSPSIDTLDLTQLSSPPPAQRPPLATFVQRSPPPSTVPTLSINLPDSPSSTRPLQPQRRSPRTSASPPAAAAAAAAWKEQKQKKRAIMLRKSLAGAFTFVDVTDSPVPNDQDKNKEKQRQRWRESEVEVLDLVGD